MEKLIILLFFALVSSVYNWYTKKQAAAGEQEQARSDSQPSSAPASKPPPPPVKRSSWEEELRRLLGEESPVPPVSRPRPAAPPVVIAPTRRPMPPAPVRQAAPYRSIPPPVKPRPVVVRAPESRPAPLPVPSVTSLSSRDLAPLAASKQAYTKAGQLDKTVAAHISNIPTEHVKPTFVLRAGVKPEVVQVAGLFKNARGARQAMIASLILGPPRALEEPG